MRVYIEPHFEGPDTGEGGIRRVVEAQKRWLPEFGWEVVDTPDEADVIHAHAVLHTKSAKPTVVTSHGLYWHEYQWEPWCYKANGEVLDAIRQADAVVAVSEWIARAIERNTWVKPTVIYHGIDPLLWPVPTKAQSRSDNDNLGRYVLFNKTRVDPICDPTPMQDLAATAPDVKFVTTFGEARGNVTVTGKVPYDDAREYVRHAGVYLCTSRETMGIGTLEAMASGVPVLGFAWGGQAEIITHGEDGYLVRPGDTEALERGLRYCLEHRERLGKAARKKVLARFTWEKVMAGYADLFDKVVEEQRDRLKVSVVIPCYNLGRYLEDAVQSVVTQPPVAGGGEIVIVDDASTDDSGAIADALASRYRQIRVIHNPRNEYLAGSLNLGIDAARGEYIVPLDADNMLGANALVVLAGELDKSNRTLDIAYGAMEMIEETGRTWVSDWPTQFNYGAQMNHANQIPSTSMYRKRIWERVGGYRRRCRTAEDADFWCRATSFGARAKKVTDGVTLRYRNRENSMSRTVADWPWNKWYAWWKGDDLARQLAPATNPVQGSVWTYEPPKISVIIPVGPGHGRFLLDALDSLLAQDYRAWEAIVVNDSGADLGWVHPFARVETTTGGLGPAAARNAGFAVSRGAALLPLDADDYLQPGALSALWNAYTYLEGKAYIYSDVLVQETGEVKEVPEYDCEKLLLKLPHAVTALYPRAAWKAVGGFDATLDAWEDWDFILALADKGICGARIPIPVFQYRMQGGKRREELYARKDELIETIKAKWAKFYVQGEKPMACGGCGQNKSPAFGGQQMVAQAALSPPVDGSMLVLEYVGRVSGPVTYRGSTTGTMYRFGLGQFDKIKFVHKDDAPGLLGRSEFQLVTPAADVLQAAGR